MGDGAIGAKSEVGRGKGCYRLGRIRILHSDPLSDLDRYGTWPMKITPLWSDSSPWIRVIPADANIPIIDALPPTGSSFTARMQGLEMPDADGVFTQFYENLRLPSYFGWNWNALRDCVEDLSWISATRYHLIIDDADSVLTGSPGERGSFFRILSGAAEYWERKPDFPEKAKVTFCVLFLCRPEACAEFRKELAGI